MQKLLNKKQILEISATVVISVFAVAAFVFGATTIGTNVSTGGTLAVTGLSSLGQATSTMLTVSGKTYLSSTLDVTGLATLGNATTTQLTVSDKTYLGDADADTLTVRAGAWSFTSTATTTVAMTNGLNFDSNTFVIDPNLNRIGVLTATPAYGLDVNGTLRVVNGVTFDSTLTVTGLATLANSTTSLATITTLYPTNVYGFTLQGNVAGNSKTITALSQLTVTGTTATSTFSTGGLTIGTDQFAIQQSSGKIGIGTTTFSSFITATGGTTATTTVEFGDQYTTGSKTCFNVKTNLGASASFYVVGTAIVVEAERCE